LWSGMSSNGFHSTHNSKHFFDGDAQGLDPRARPPFSDDELQDMESCPPLPPTGWGQPTLDSNIATMGIDNTAMRTANDAVLATDGCSTGGADQPIAGVKYRYIVTPAGFGTVAVGNSSSCSDRSASGLGNFAARAPIQSQYSNDTYQAGGTSQSGPGPVALLRPPYYTGSTQRAPCSPLIVSGLHAFPGSFDAKMDTSGITDTISNLKASGLNDALASEPSHVHYRQLEAAEGSRPSLGPWPPQRPADPDLQYLESSSLPAHTGLASHGLGDNIATGLDGYSGLIRTGQSGVPASKLNIGVHPYGAVDATP
jgi:hypothetical protein